MRILVSNLMIKALIMAAVVVGVVAINQQQSNVNACDRVSYMPNHSAVFQCPAGFSVASLRNPYHVPIFTTVTTTVKAEGWLTKTGDSEDAKTIENKLGPPVVVGPGAFMAVAEGEGLVYIKCPQKYLLSVVWNVPGTN